MTNRKLRYSGLGLALFTAGAMAACSSDEPATPPGTAGTGSGGAPGTAGGTAAGAPGTAGAGVAGSAAGAAPTAGTGGGTSAGFACQNTMPTAALITDFSNLVANPTSAGNYTFTGGVLGGTFAYQPNALTLDTVTNTVLNIKGNVHAYDGFGLYFNTCYDASAYTGVSFSVKGYAGPKGKLNFRVQTNTNTAIDTPNMKGQCVSALADTYPDCHASAFDIPVTATPTVVTVLWGQLAGGVPIAAVTGNNVVGLEWAFDWTPGAVGAAGSGAGGAATGSGGSGGGASGGKGGGTSGGSGGAATGAGGAPPAAGPYDADITIDDVKFLGGPPAGGAGGAPGGASGSGSGGASTGGGGANGGSGGAKAGGGGTAGH